MYLLKTTTNWKIRKNVCWEANEKHKIHVFTTDVGLRLEFPVQNKTEYLINKYNPLSIVSKCNKIHDPATLQQMSTRNLDIINTCATAL